ncbi:unnamed protein product [Rotaria sp. Silwood1]|nr:unnamed protein product [Rotaria sp. Silwood1]
MIEFCLICYMNDGHMIKKIDEFERDYRSQAAIHWYTKNTFPFQMVNAALRTHDLSTLYPMRVFIQDVHKQIVQLHANLRQTQPLTLYRGVPMPIEEFERIKSNPGGLLSNNSFWSTSADKTVAQLFSGNYDGAVEVLFVINVDRSVRTTAVFANIEEESQFGDNEKEYLFTMGSIFRIESIEKPDTNGFWYVNLRSTNDNDPQLTVLKASIRSAVTRDSGSHICGLGLLMMYMDEHELAAQILETIIERETNSLERMKIQWTLGLLYTKLSKKQQALMNYDKVVKNPALRFIPTSLIAILYHGLGDLCINLEKFDLALINMEIALHVEILCVPYHSEENLARYCRDIGLIYERKGHFKDALSFYQIGLEKAEKCYPSQHPLVNRCALDLARIYGYLGQEQHAESILQRHVPTIHDSLPPNHSMQIPYHMYTGHSLLKQGDFSGAHAHFQSALTLDLGHREANHPGGSFIHSAIGMAFGREGRYNEALDAFTTALQVQMATLAPEHPDIASTYIELGKIFELLGNVSEALFNYERGMDIYLKIVPPTDPIIAQTEQHIRRLYKKLDHYHASQSM